jgi:hypothetical protein
MAAWDQPISLPPQRDYSGFLRDAISSVGDPIVANREAATRKALADRDYARQLQEDELAKEAFGFRKSQAELGQSNEDRDYALRLRQYEHPNTASGVPTGYRATDSGMEPMPGGPADPATIRAQAEARAGGTGTGRIKPLPATTVKALGDAGSAVADVGRVNSGFKDEFAGWGSQTVGDIANFAGRNLGVGNTEAAEWWQDYQAQKNIRRHALFGSALTKTESASFDKADVNPGMTPDAIKTNLARQEMIAKRAASKLAKAYVAQGYSPEVVEGALGVSLEDLGLAAPGGGGGGVSREEVQGIVDEAMQQIQEGADPEAVKAKLLELGIDLDAMVTR